MPRNREHRLRRAARARADETARHSAALQASKNPPARTGGRVFQRCSLGKRACPGVDQFTSTDPNDMRAEVRRDSRQLLVQQLGGVESDS